MTKTMNPQPTTAELFALAGMKFPTTPAVSAETKARRNARAVGYVCKQCGTASPVGIGYAIIGTEAELASANLTQCECGYSVRP